MPKDPNRKPWRWLWLSALVIILDQITKYFAVQHLTFGIPKIIFSFFNLNINFNTGAAFSFLGNASGWQVYLFTVISLLVAVFLVIWLIRSRRADLLTIWGICLIVGGAVGNLIDRIRLKYVIDFFDFHLHHWHFATFNLADSAVCVGAFLLILRLSFFKL